MNKLTKVIPVGAMALMIGAMPPVALADYSRDGGVKSTTCVKKIYREEYIPGTGPSNPGWVRSWYERKKVPCRGHASAPPVDDNSCIEGSIIGGIAGGAAGGTLATKKNWVWSIPAGVIGGAMVGCQVDGG